MKTILILLWWLFRIAIASIFILIYTILISIHWPITQLYLKKVKKGKAGNKLLEYTLLLLNIPLKLLIRGIDKLTSFRNKKR